MPNSNIKCPHCSQLNTLVLSELPPWQEIHCSRCRAPLGNWSVIEAGSLPPHDSANDFSQDWPHIREQL